MVNRAGKTFDGLLQLGAIGLRLLQRGGHGGERRFQFVRDRIEKGFLEFLRLAGEINLRPKITIFPLDRVNEALSAVKSDQIDGAAVIVT